jgi:exonuclease V gamma subunit
MKVRCHIHCFDVAVARAHPLFSAFRQLLDLAQARVTAPEVVDLLACRRSRASSASAPAMSMC